MELKKTILDRMVHLLSHDCVLPVVSYIRKSYEKGDTDISLIRHFVTEVGFVLTRNAMALHACNNVCAKCLEMSIVFDNSIESFLVYDNSMGIFLSATIPRKFNQADFFSFIFTHYVHN